jgi:hypothetical protein
MHDMKTFWEGYHDALVETLNMDIPNFAEVKDKNRPKLEDWRRVQNAYYRVYNDGDGWVSKLRHIAKRYGMAVNGSNSSHKNLEKLARRVFHAAIAEYQSVHGTLIRQNVVEYTVHRVAEKKKIATKLKFRADCNDPAGPTLKLIRAALERATDLNLQDATLKDMVTVAKFLKVRKVQADDKQLLSDFVDAF